MKDNRLNPDDFWVTNFSDRNVTLGDLYVSIPAKSSVNLLDKKHYKFNLEEIIKSAENGSIFKKRHLICVRKVPPQMIPKAIIERDPKAIIPTRSKSNYEIKYDYYEELDINKGIEEILESTESLIPEKKNGR